MRSAKWIAVVAGMAAVVAGTTAGARAQGADSRLVDGAEGALSWEDGKLGTTGVVQSIQAGAEARAGSRSVAVQLDSLDGAQDTTTLGWPRQAGVQTNAIPASCVNMSQAKRISISVKAVQDTPVGAAWLQARIYLKTGDAWLWHTTEERDGKQAMANVMEGDWVTLERDVEDFYASGDSVAGIKHAENLKSVGIQFFTYNGPWSGTVYIDEVRLVDAVTDPSAISPGAKAASGRSGPSAAGPRFRPDGKRIRTPSAGMRVYSLPVR